MSSSYIGSEADSDSRQRRYADEWSENNKWPEAAGITSPVSSG